MGRGNELHLSLGGSFGGHFESSAVTLPQSHLTNIMMLPWYHQHLEYVKMPPLSPISFYFWLLWIQTQKVQQKKKKRKRKKKVGRLLLVKIILDVPLFSLLLFFLTNKSFEKESCKNYYRAFEFFQSTFKYYLT